MFAPDDDGIEIPEHLEDLVHEVGPFTLANLVEKTGGLVSAAELAQVSVGTLSRWMDHVPGKAFCGRREKQRTHYSVWPGYPPPFPILDRVTEELFGTSFLAALRNEDRSISWCNQILHDKLFGIRNLGIHKDEFIEACRAKRIPSSTRMRIWADLSYPNQLEKLDRLSIAMEGRSFLMLVIRQGAPPKHRKIPKRQLHCLVNHLFSS
jgi:hypothetical protein